MNHSRGPTSGSHTPTIAEGEVMKAALLRYLRGEPGSSLEHRALLVRMTEQAPAWLDGDGKLRIGAWLFDAGMGAPTLRYRLPPTDGAVVRFYVAQLARERDAWTVARIQHEHVRAREGGT